MQLRADFKIYARRVERTERCKRICGVKYGAKFNVENRALKTAVFKKVCGVKLRAEF